MRTSDGKGGEVGGKARSSGSEQVKSGAGVESPHVLISRGRERPLSQGRAASRQRRRRSLERVGGPSGRGMRLTRPEAAAAAGRAGPYMLTYRNGGWHTVGEGQGASSDALPGGCDGRSS